MLPDVAGIELVVIAIVALIVVGPKDLPLLLRKLGQFMGKLRAMAAEFRASFDEMARQSELDELRKEVEAMRRGQFGAAEALQADEAQINQVFEEIHEGLAADNGMSLSPAVSHEYAAPAELPPSTVAAESAPEPAKPKRRAAPKTDAATPKAAAKRPAKSEATVSGAPKRRKPGTVT